MRDGLYSLYLRVVIGRKRLEDMVTRYGREDPQVVKFSQRLDRDVVELQRMMLYAG